MKYVVSKDNIVEEMKANNLTEQEIQEHVNSWINRVDGKVAEEICTNEGIKIWACPKEHIVLYRTWLERVGNA